MATIQVIEVRVFTYAPDLTEEYYKDNNATTLEQAAVIDKADVRRGDTSLDELSAKEPHVSRIWSIIGE